MVGNFSRKSPGLALVENGPNPPRKLGVAGQSLWNRVQSEFRILDVGGVELLMQCCEAADRIQALRAIIDQDGERIQTKHGIKSHPCLRDELAARAFVCRTLQRLGITDVAIQPIGRPGVVRDWTPEY
jgi:hypothetical protein